ncbi:MAG: hypothetical protein JW929_04950 [Anaerolineales bacterium]|nr:hypothetical protein [Anaerolineales bacterium]
MELPRQTHASLLVVIRRPRNLPARGTIHLRLNQKVSPADIVGRTTLAPAHYLFDIAHGLGLPPAKADRFLRRETDERVSAGDILAGPVGWMRRVVRAPEDGRVVLQGDGRLLFEGLGEGFELRAGLPGIVIGMEPDLGATIETVGALVEGIWGNGRQEFGVLRVATPSSATVLAAADLNIDLRGAVAVAGRLDDPDIFHAMEALPLRGVICGSMPSALIPAAEASRLPVILTEGFGDIPMNSAVFELFATNVGREASVNAQQTDSWKGLRPEVIIPLPAVGSADVPSEAVQLVVGRRVRVLRAPYAGQVGSVVSLPEGLMPIGNGIRVTCAEVELGETGLVRVPIANLDILE